MKYAFVAAALLGVALAGESSTYVDWENVPAPTEGPKDPKGHKPYDPKGPEGDDKSSTWAEVSKPADPTTKWEDQSSKKADPTTKWEDQSSKKADPTTKWEEQSSKKADPTTKWEEQSSKKADPTTKWEEQSKSVDPTKSTWEALTTPMPTATCSYIKKEVKTFYNPKDHDKYFTKTFTKTIYPKDCKTKTWGDWEETTTVEGTVTVTEWAEIPADPAPTTVWEAAPVDPTKSWEAIPVDPTKSWEATPVEATTTTSWAAASVDPSKTWEATPIAATTTVAQWSKDGWFGPAWTMKAGECGFNTVTSYGAAVWKPTPEASSSSSWETYVVPTSSDPSTWGTYAAPTTTESAIATTWATYVAKETEKAGKSEGHAPIAPNGDKWSMTYTPYNAQGKCKTQDVIKSDIKKLADLGFTSVRVYSTDCMTLEYVGGACEEYGLKIILGVFISKTGIKGAQKQVTDIVSWGKWSIVELIVIGNEAIFQGFCSADDLAWFIKDSKTKFQAAGYTGGCTTTEPLNEWQKDGSKFCAVVDVVSANLYAYFNPETKAEDAGTFVQSQIEILAKICPGKETYVMESGWPHAGECNGKACPSKDNQAVAIKKIQETSGAKVVFFSFEDEQWKEPGQFGVEQSWGCADVFGQGSDKPKATASPWSSY